MGDMRPITDLPFVPIKDLGGAGPDVLLIHGFGSDRMSWLANTSVLQSIAHLRTLDLPGHGAAGTDVGNGAIEVLASAVEAAIVREELARLTVVGHSLGGGIALLLAAARPDLVGALVLIAPAGLGVGVDRKFLDTFPKLEGAEATEALLQRLVTRPRLINKQLVALVQRQLAVPGAREALARVAGGINRSGPALRTACETVARGDLPRVVIWGDGDSINPPDHAVLERFGGETLFIPDVGHLPHVEAAAVVNGTIRKMLLSCPANVRKADRST